MSINTMEFDKKAQNGKVFTTAVRTTMTIMVMIR